MKEEVIALLPGEVLVMSEDSFGCHTRVRKVQPAHSEHNPRRLSCILQYRQSFATKNHLFQNAEIPIEKS